MNTSTKIKTKNGTVGSAVFVARSQKVVGDVSVCNARGLANKR